MTIKFDKTKLTKNLGQNNILVPYLDRAFDSFDEPWEFKYEGKESDDAWHPSGDCTPTVTALYKKATGEKQERPNGSLLKSFMVGHYWHQLIQHVIVHKLELCGPEAIERKGVSVWGRTTSHSSEEPHPLPYHWVTGQGDIAPLETKRWRGIVDIKTIGGDQFKVCKDTKRLPVRFEKKYLCQIQIYMDLFNEDRGLILGVNKDSPHDFIEFQFTCDQKLVDAIYAKWKFVSECLDNKTTPTEEDDKRFALLTK